MNDKKTENRSYYVVQLSSSSSAAAAISPGLPGCTSVIDDSSGEWRRQRPVGTPRACAVRLPLHSKLDHAGMEQQHRVRGRSGAAAAAAACCLGYFDIKVVPRFPLAPPKMLLAKAGRYTSFISNDRGCNITAASADAGQSEYRLSRELFVAAEVG